MVRNKGKEPNENKQIEKNLDLNMAAKKINKDRR
jgi:hypothetical protein